MNKIVYILPLLLLFFLTSCNETKEHDEFYNWRERNEAFIDSLQGVVDSKSDPMLYFTVDQNSKKNIFFKKIKDRESTGGVRPAYNSSVKTFYRGVLINEEVFSKVTSPYLYTRYYKDLTVFDKNFLGDDPDPEFDVTAEFGVNQLITGWTWVLQQMYPGERWEVYIPWESAYGAEEKGNIPSYSALIFDLELVEISEY